MIIVWNVHECDKSECITSINEFSALYSIGNEIVPNNANNREYFQTQLAVIHSVWHRK